MPEARAPGVPIAHLFAEGRAAATSLIWVANFMNIVNAYFVASWLPTVVRDMGYSTSIGVMTGATVQVGGVIGTLAIAGIVARVGFVRVLVACFAVETVAIALIGQPGLSLALLFVVAFLTGWGIFGGQPTLNSLSATYYPTDLRSTGIGAALGVGRVGAIIGPWIGGEMLGAQWSTSRCSMRRPCPRRSRRWPRRYSPGRSTEWGSRRRRRLRGTERRRSAAQLAFLSSRKRSRSKRQR